MSERVQPITSAEQPDAEAAVDLVPLDAQPLADASQANALRQAVADAQTAPLIDRPAVVGRITSLLVALQPQEANGRLLVDLLHSGVLTDLVDENQRDARREAVRALLRLGFPWALEIDPDTLAWFRGAESRQRNRRLTALAVVASTLLALGAYVWATNEPAPRPPPPPIVAPVAPVPPSPPRP